MTVDQIKRQVAVKIRDHCRKVSLTQTEVAFFSGMTQPRVSRIFNLNLENISLDALFKLVENLDLNVTITIE